MTGLLWNRKGQETWWSCCECSKDRMGTVTGLLWDRAGQDRWWSGCECQQIGWGRLLDCCGTGQDKWWSCCECSTDRMWTVIGLLLDRTGQDRTSGGAVVSVNR